MNVADYILIGRDPEKTALLSFDDQQCTYGELAALVRQTASVLIAAGLAKGDRVLLLAENSIFWVVGYLASLFAGLVAVPLPGKILSDHLQYVIDATEPSHAFVTPLLMMKHGARLGSMSVTTVLASTPQAPLPKTVAAAADNDLAALMFTSGSTGKPRGVMVSHRNIIANTDSIIAALQPRPADRVMVVLPFYYCFGTSLLHSNLRIGATLVLENQFPYPEVVLQHLAEAECTGFAGVPSHYQILLRKSGLRHWSLPSLRYVQQAGGHLAPVFVRELREALPHTDIYIMYGQTEATARLSVLPPNMIDQKVGSIGRAIPGVTLRLLDESGRVVDPGRAGEIVAQGDNIALGYWRDEDETSKSFRDSALYTGDLAVMDPEGFLFIVDRARDVLKVGGKRVSCREVEDLLAECNCVQEVAVIGVPDDILGEAVKAFVVPREGESDCAQRLKTFCRETIPAILNPKEIVTIKALPKNNSGKILKRELRGL